MALSGPRADASSRTCYVHIGTHKTGSTALQHFLYTRAEYLAAHGVYVPVSGRLADSPEGCGHHCLAWDLLGSEPDSPISGTLESLIVEIGAQSLPVACVSSEELEHLHLKPNNLARLYAGLRGIGYRTVIVVYLRPQADLLEALYAEVTRHAPVREFWACYREVLEHGALDLWPGNRLTAMFDYERLIAPFSSVVGRGNVIVRPFHRHRNPANLIDDFARTVIGRHAAVASSDSRDVRRINERVTFARVVHGICTNRHELRQRPVEPRLQAAVAACDGPFDPLRPHEMVKIALRFWRSNLRLMLRYRVFIGCVSRRQLFAALRSSMRRNDPKRRRFEALGLLFGHIASNHKESCGPS